VTNYELPDETKVLVATPNYTNIFSAESHVNHIECACEWTRWGLPFSWTVVGRTFVHFARTQLCQVAIEAGFTHVFWVDDDAIITPEMLPRFISHDKDIVIAPYPMRRSPFQVGILSATSYVCKDCGEEGYDANGSVYEEDARCSNCDSKNVWRNFHTHGSYRNFTLKDLGRGLQPVDGGGTHAMLVKLDALTQRRGWPPPKFGEEIDAENKSYPPEMIRVYNALVNNLSEADKSTIDDFIGDLPDQSLTFKEEDETGKPYFLMPKTGTEDMYFCYRAKCKNIEIYCDTDVFASHVGFPSVITDDFTAEAERIKTLPEGEQSGVHLMKVDGNKQDEGRDHTGINAERVANLV